MFSHSIKLIIILSLAGVLFYACSPCTVFPDYPGCAELTNTNYTQTDGEKEPVALGKRLWKIVYYNDGVMLGSQRFYYVDKTDKYVASTNLDINSTLQFSTAFLRDSAGDIVEITITNNKKEFSNRYIMAYTNEGISKRIRSEVWYSLNPATYGFDAFDKSNFYRIDGYGNTNYTVEWYDGTNGIITNKFSYDLQLLLTNVLSTNTHKGLAGSLSKTTNVHTIYYDVSNYMTNETSLSNNVVYNTWTYAYTNVDSKVFLFVKTNSTNNSVLFDYQYAYDSYGRLTNSITRDSTGEIITNTQIYYNQDGRTNLYIIKSLHYQTNNGRVSTYFISSNLKYEYEIYYDGYADNGRPAVE